MGFLDAIKGVAGFAAPFLGPVGSIAGALIDQNSQKQANQTTAQSVENQIEFQREQNATQYQRAVADMKKAGLNPALAYQQGGNSAGTGASYTAQPTTSNTGAKLTDAINAYNQFANGTAQRALLRAQAENATASAGLTQAQTANPEYALWMARGDGVAGYRQAVQSKLLYEAKNFPRQFEANLRNLNQTTDTSAQSARESKTRATLNEQEFQNEFFRRNIAPYLNSTAKTLKTAGAFIPELRFR